MTTKESYDLYNKLLNRDLQKNSIDYSNFSYCNKWLIDRVSAVFNKSKKITSASICGVFPENKENQLSLEFANKHNIPLYLIEDAFLRSADTWANSKVGPKYRRTTCGVMIDSLGYYFDATRHGNLELMLNNKNLTLSNDELIESRRLIDKIVKNKLSKYNHQPIYKPSYGDPNKPSVLLVDQSGGDWSLKLGMVNDDTFDLMLSTAVKENPNSNILVKIHPDTLTGKRKSCFTNLDNYNVIKISDPINPYSLLEVVDKVYVATSQFGFESLMVGKEVHTFGMPFYAGWGLTIDYLTNSYRTNNRSLEELFYITYCKYTKWIDPRVNKETDIDTIINYLLRLRREYLTEYGVRSDDMANNTSIVWCVDKDLNNNIMLLQSITSANKNTKLCDFYVLTLKDNPFNYYLKKLNVKIIEVDKYLSLFNSLKTNSHSSKLSIFTYVRYLIFKLEVFKKYSHVIYLDNDIIINRSIDSNLIKLCDEIELIGAVRESDSDRNKGFAKYREFCSNHKLKYDKSNYMNAGVLVLNSKVLTDVNFNNLVKLSMQGFPLNDQDTLNNYFLGRIKFIKSKYNLFTSTKYGIGSDTVVMRHYAGSDKIKSNDLFSKYYINNVFKKYL